MSSDSPIEPAVVDSAQCSDVSATEAVYWSPSYLQAVVDRRLRVLVPNVHQPPQLLHQAIAYSLLAPGKRLRPLIVLMTSHHFGRRDLAALDAACAIEMVHAASLIMDDLPAMDDAQERRGKPTAHRQFGEDIAVLSGIALLNMAFGVIASTEAVPHPVRVELVRLLSSSIGSGGLVGGQVMDLRMRSAAVRQAELERINGLKTGSLFAAAAEAGALVAGASQPSLDSARRFASEFGLAFQIADDVLDGLAHSGRTGKDTGQDAGKPTLLTVIGEDSARMLHRTHLARCRGHLAEIDATDAPLGLFIEQCLAQVRV